MSSSALEGAGDAEAEVYDRSIVLSRPDQHVAWRGDAPPTDIGALLDRVTGRDTEGRCAGGWSSTSDVPGLA